MNASCVLWSLAQSLRSILLCAAQSFFMGRLHQRCGLPLCLDPPALMESVNRNSLAVFLVVRPTASLSVAPFLHILLCFLSFLSSFLHFVHSFLSSFLPFFIPSFVHSFLSFFIPSFLFRSFLFSPPVLHFFPGPFSSLFSCAFPPVPPFQSLPHCFPLSFLFALFLSFFSCSQSMREFHPLYLIMPPLQ